MPADDPSQPRVVQIGAALIDADGEPRATIDRIIKPDGWEIPADAARIHGITTERAESEGVAIAEGIADLMALWDAADVVASYGVLFDTKMLRSELRRLALPDRFGEKPEFCVMKAATDQCKIAPTNAMMASGRKWSKTAKLSEACEILLGRKHETAHTAMGDVMVTVDLYRWLVKRNLVAPKRRESFTPAAAQ